MAKKPPSPGVWELNFTFCNATTQDSALSEKTDALLLSPCSLLSPFSVLRSVWSVGDSQTSHPLRSIDKILSQSTHASRQSQHLISSAYCLNATFTAGPNVRKPIDPPWEPAHLEKLHKCVREMTTISSQKMIRLTRPFLNQIGNDVREIFCRKTCWPKTYRLPIAVVRMLLRQCARHTRQRLGIGEPERPFHTIHLHPTMKHSTKLDKRILVGGDPVDAPEHVLQRHIVHMHENHVGRVYALHDIQIWLWDGLWVLDQISCRFGQCRNIGRKTL
mmetsp:Transcript_54/g.143  ORF Transcript_54/g.143 Transcript_54/m.143 type:complete len:275 (-) Transcript_54:125-949(-)